MIILVDLDDTLCQSAWRSDMIADGWDAYYQAAAEDKPIAEFCELVNNLSRLNQVWVATARPERWRKLSTDWLVRHKVSVMGLLMRRNDDFRQAPAVKLTQAAEKFTRVEKVSLVIDSRDDVLGAFRGAGVSALQSMAVAR